MLYFILGMVGLVALSGLFDNEDDAGAIFVLDEEDDDLTGTSGDDTVTADPDAASLGADMIDTGDGDDLIDLLDAENQRAFWAERSGVNYDDTEIVTSNSDQPAFGGSIDAGNGDDTINARLTPFTTVNAGGGDDQIFVENGEIYGGEGDDYIEAVNTSAYEVDVYGGAGNDTIDGLNNVNGLLSGGPGDDFLIATGGGNEGDGFVSLPSGGEGDDTIRYDVITDLSEVESTGRQVAVGGEGSDRFELLINEGDPRDWAGSSYDPIFDGLVYDGEPDDEPYLVDTEMDILDFTPGEDTLVLELSTRDDSYSVTSVSMAEVMNRGGEVETEVTISYDSETARDHDIVVRLSAVGVTWDDVELIGADRSVLVPLTA